MSHVHVPAIHDEYNCYALQACPNKNENEKDC